MMYGDSNHNLVDDNLLHHVNKLYNTNDNINNAKLKPDQPRCYGYKKSSKIIFAYQISGKYTSILCLTYNIKS